MHKKGYIARTVTKRFGYAPRDVHIIFISISHCRGLPFNYTFTHVDLVNTGLEPLFPLEISTFFACHSHGIDLTKY